MPSPSPTPLPYTLCPKRRTYCECDLLPLAPILLLILLRKLVGSRWGEGGLILPPPLYDPSRPAPPSKRCTHTLIRAPSANCSASAMPPLWPDAFLFWPRLSSPRHFPKNDYFFLHPQPPFSLSLPPICLSNYLSSNYCITSPLSILETCQSILSIYHPNISPRSSYTSTHFAPICLLQSSPPRFSLFSFTPLQLALLVTLISVWFDFPTPYPLLSYLIAPRVILSAYYNM